MDQMLSAFDSSFSGIEPGQMENTGIKDDDLEEIIAAMSDKRDSLTEDTITEIKRGKIDEISLNCEGNLINEYSSNYNYTLEIRYKIYSIKHPCFWNLDLKFLHRIIKHYPNLLI